MKSTILLILPIAAFVLLLSSGCSVAGYSLGSAIDHNRDPSYLPISCEQVFALERGDEVEVREEGQAARRVTFLKMQPPDEDALVADVPDRGKETTSTASVNAGDRILIEEAGKEPVKGVFLGASTTDIWYKLPDEPQVRKCPFASLTRIRSGAFSINEYYLSNVIKGRLQCVYELAVLDAGIESSIPMCRIASVRTAEYPTTARYTMGGIGLGIDLLVVGTAVLLKSLESDGDGGGFGAFIGAMTTLSGSTR
jgi:hypothetical protein